MALPRPYKGDENSGAARRSHRLPLIPSTGSGQAQPSPARGEGQFPSIFMVMTGRRPLDGAEQLEAVARLRPRGVTLLRVNGGMDRLLACQLVI